MASKASPFSRKDIQEAIKTQGEIIRQLKLEEQTDEVKKKVKLTPFFFQPISFEGFMASRTCREFESGISTWC